MTSPVWPGGTLVACGGGYIGEHGDTYSFEKPPDGAECWPVETTPIDERTLELAEKDKPRVLLIPTATEGSTRHNLGLFIDAFRDHWSKLGATVDVLRLLPESEGDRDTSSKIDDADVLFVSGGVTHQLLECWARTGVAAMMKNAANSGAVIAGNSAGAVCWFTATSSNSHYTGQPYLLRCFGWIDAVVCPHWNTQLFRQEPFAAMVNGYRRGVAIDDLAALEITGDRYRVLSADGKAWAYECVWADEEFNVVSLPDEGPLAALAASAAEIR